MLLHSENDFFKQLIFVTYQKNNHIKFLHMHFHFKPNINSKKLKNMSLFELSQNIIGILTF